MMIKYFLVLTFWSNGNPAPTTIPQYYETRIACKQSGEVALGEYQGRGEAGYTCVPWNSEGD